MFDGALWHAGGIWSMFSHPCLSCQAVALSVLRSPCGLLSDDGGYSTMFNLNVQPDIGRRKNKTTPLPCRFYFPIRLLPGGPTRDTSVGVGRQIDGIGIVLVWVPRCRVDICLKPPGQRFSRFLLPLEFDTVFGSGAKSLADANTVVVQ